MEVTAVVIFIDEDTIDIEDVEAEDDENERI